MVTAVAGAALLLLSVIFTSPSALGPIGVTIWFVLLFVSTAAMSTVGLFVSKRYLRWHDSDVARLRYSQRQGLLIAGWLTGCLALSSLKQLGWLDAILLGLILLIVEIYVRFRWP